MKFVAGELNKQRLRDLLAHNIDDCLQVRAAVAYAHHNNLALFEECKSHNKPLLFFGRYDGTVPVTPEVLRWFLQQNSPSLSCRLVPDILHAKVIWWEGCGAYFGSANLTDRAWNSNIEAGIFLTDFELEDNFLIGQLEDFFQVMVERSVPLNSEIYEEQRRLDEEYRSRLRPTQFEIERSFEKGRFIPRDHGLVFHDRKSAVDRMRRQFLKEWSETLQLMRMIGAKVSTPESRPLWIEADVPLGVQADQFLHSYYYQRVREGASQPFERHYQKNSRDPGRALAEALNWWRSGEYEHTYEENTIYAWAPTLRSMLSRDRLDTLSIDEFATIAQMVHAMRDYASKQDNALLGIPGPHANVDEKALALGRLLFTSHSRGGKSAPQTIQHVLYGGTLANLPERLFEATHSDMWKVPRLGLSSLGELVGWAMPEHFPPRNARSSKALRALGNDVQIYI
jgi:hypothetical protein